MQSGGTRGELADRVLHIRLWRERRGEELDVLLGSRGGAAKQVRVILGGEDVLELADAREVELTGPQQFGDERKALDEALARHPSESGSIGEAEVRGEVREDGLVAELVVEMPPLHLAEVEEELDQDRARRRGE